MIWLFLYGALFCLIAFFSLQGKEGKKYIKPLFGLSLVLGTLSFMNTTGAAQGIAGMIFVSSLIFVFGIAKID